MAATAEARFALSVKTTKDSLIASGIHSQTESAGQVAQRKITRTIPNV